MCRRLQQLCAGVEKGRSVGSQGTQELEPATCCARCERLATSALDSESCDVMGAGSKQVGGVRSPASAEAPFMLVRIDPDIAFRAHPGHQRRLEDTTADHRRAS